MDDIIDANTLFGPLPEASTDLTVDQLLALMQKHNVRAACTLSTLGLLLDPTIGNAATRAACSEHPELLPVATLNPLMYFGDTASVTRLKADGFRLIRFFPSAQDWPVDFAPFRSLAESLNESGLPLMVNVRAPGEITALTGVLRAYPSPVILAGVEAPMLAEAVAALRQCPNWHIEISRLLGPGCLQAVADTAGAERLLFGTSAPSRPISSALQTLRFSGLSEDAQRLAFSANARRIFGIA